MVKWQTQETQNLPLIASLRVQVPLFPPLNNRTHMNYENKLKSLNLAPDTSVTLTYSDGCDVFIHNDTAIETALKETNTVTAFSRLVEHLAAVSDETHWILEQLRDDYVIDYDDEEDDAGNVSPVRLDFTDISDALDENFGEQSFIESTIERYDHKRGRCTLTATVDSTVAEILKNPPDLTGWDIMVETDNGMLTIEG